MPGLLEMWRDRRQARGKETPLLDGILTRMPGLLEDPEEGESRFPWLAEHSNALLGASAGIMGAPGHRAWAGGLEGFTGGADMDRQLAEQRRQRQEEAARQAAYDDALSGAPMLQDGQRGLLSALGPEAGAGYLLENGWGGGEAADQPWEPYTDAATGWTGLIDPDTGAINWNPEGMQPTGGAAADAPDLRELVGPDGQTHVYGWNPETSRFDIDMGLAEPARAGMSVTLPDGTVVTQGGTGAGAVTMDERRAAALYATSANEMAIVQQTFEALTSLANQAGGAIPLVGNFTVTPEYQRARQSLAALLQNFLVVTSGQAVTEQEFARRLDQVLPKPGDQEPVLADKLARVQSWLDAIGGYADRALQREDEAPAAAGPAPGNFTWTPEAGLVPVP